MYSKVCVILDEEQQTELKVILNDEDGAAALSYLKEVIWVQVQDVRRKEMRSHLEMGAA